MNQKHQMHHHAKRSVNRFAALISKTGIFLLNSLSRLPLSMLYLFSAFIYHLVYHIFGYRRKVVMENLHNAFPDKNPEELRAIEKRFFKHLSRLVVEIFKMRSISAKELSKRVYFKNLDLITAYLDKGKSILLCSPHYGNWEWGVMALGLHVRSNIYTIYKPLSNKAFDKWFYDMRHRFGNALIPMRNTLRAVHTTAQETSIFCFANDQAPPREESHHWINFLNQPTSFHLGVEKIAIKTNRPVFYSAIRYKKKGHYEVEFIPICLDPEKAVTNEITTTYAKQLAEVLRTEPPYWLWSHKRWKHKPDHTLIPQLQSI